MTVRNSTLLGAALLALTGTAMAQAKPPVTQPASQDRVAAIVHPAGIARASVLVGKHVLDDAGKNVGEVKDFIACDSGDLIVLVERHADDKLVGVPMSALSPRAAAAAPHSPNDAPASPAAATAAVDGFSIAADARFAVAPVIADRKAMDPAWWTAYGEHYGIKDLARHETAGDKAPTAMQAAGHAGAVCVVQLFGQDVKSAAGEDLGDVKDVAISLADGKVAYVVISTGANVLGMNSTLHGVRFASLVPDTERKFLTLQTDKATLARTTGIDLDRLPARPNFEVPAAAAPLGRARTEKSGDSPR